MSLRPSIHAILLVAALAGALPVRTTLAAEAAPDSTSLEAPRLVDPSAAPAPEATLDGLPGMGAAESEALLNQPAIEDIELQMNADVLRYIAFFTGAGRSTFERWLKRSGRYMELFRSVLQKEGLPPDLVHLVFVESGFNVNARSYASAVGPWQFMRATSRLFGLNVNQWVDERKDPEKATVAAARYLKHLYGIFGDWPLALASYNAGEGTVMRAIKAQGTNNYWELRLPKQTEDYVPQFMAAMAITRDPVKYGFTDILYDDPMRFDEVSLKGAVDLRAIAKLAECDYEELKELNPSVRNAMVQGANGITSIRVPEGKSEIIQRKLSEGADLPRVNLTVRHRVRSGETLRSIAAEFSVNPNDIARVNKLGRGRPLRKGMLITIPSTMRAPRPAVIAADTTDPRASTAYVPSRRIGLPARIDGNSVPIDRVTHVVKRGETMASIAARYGVSAEDLRRWNRLKNVSVRPGARLRIRSTEVADDSTGTDAAVLANGPADVDAPAEESPARRHTVGRGETLTSIASRYQVTVADLRRWNSLRKGVVVKRGQSLLVSGPSAEADGTTLDAPARESRTTAKRAATTHTVRRGETLSSIATKHGVTVAELKRLNRLTSTNVKVGQRLKLPA